MKRMKYSVEELKEAVTSSFSIRQVLQKLSIVAAGGNYKSIKKQISKHQLDTSHFTGQACNRGKKLQLRVPIEEYLSNRKPILSFSLKNRLLREGFLTSQCSSCCNVSWLGGPIPLELDHIDGKSNNNSLENLRLLCPNCHALTPTYRGKNISKA